MKTNAMRTLPKIIAVAAAGLASAASAAVETYTIDPVHSSVGFTIRHFVSRVPCRFTQFSGTITVDRDSLENSSVDAVIETTSFNTFNDRRDADVKSPSYLDVAKHGTMTFKSTSWKKTGDGMFDVTGNLTIKETTRPVVLKVTLLGFGPGMRGAQLSGWEAATTISRTEFGVNGPPMVGKVLGDDVAISITVEADLKQ